MPYNTRKINADINPTGIGKRSFAFLIDLAASAVVMMLVYSALVYPLWYHQFGGYQAEVELEEAKEASGLFTSPYVVLVDEEHGATTVFDQAYRLDDPAAYNLATLRIDQSQTTPGLANFKIVAENWLAPIAEYEVLYLRAIATYYTLGNQYFEFRNSSYFTNENTTFELAPDVYWVGQADSYFVLTTDPTPVLALKDGVDPADALGHIQDVYNQAIANFEKTTIFHQLRKPLADIVIWGYAGALTFGLMLFDLLIPLLLGEGRSLGKFLLGLAVVTNQGYRIKPWQLLLRFAILGGVEVILSFKFFVLPLLISSSAVTLTKRNQSLHDLVAGTWVVDWQNSKIFVNEDAANEWKVKTALQEPTSIIPGGGLFAPKK